MKIKTLKTKTEKDKIKTKTKTKKQNDEVKIKWNHYLAPLGFRREDMLFLDNDMVDEVKFVAVH